VPSSLYKVDTQTVVVTISLAVDLSLRGDMFLRPSIVTLSGVESIADRLNDRDGFFPLRMETGRTEVIGKAQVRYVAADAQAIPDEVLSAPEGDATQFQVTVELDTGKALSGVFHAVLPRGKRRALDYINAPHMGAFVPLYVGPRVYVVHRAFIRRLREQMP